MPSSMRMFRLPALAVVIALAAMAAATTFLAQPPAHAQQPGVALNPACTSDTPLPSPPGTLVSYHRTVACFVNNGSGELTYTLSVSHPHVICWGCQGAPRVFLGASDFRVFVVTKPPAALAAVIEPSASGIAHTLSVTATNGDGDSNRIEIPLTTGFTTPVAADYDFDDDRVIDIYNLNQLNAIRHDQDGHGTSTHADYTAAFPNSATAANTQMGCPATDANNPKSCIGYELHTDLDFRSDDSYATTTPKSGWTTNDGNATKAWNRGDRAYFERHYGKLEVREDESDT